MSSQKASSENNNKLQTNSISKSQINFPSSTSNTMKTVYSDYGYLSINQQDLTNESELISFEKELGKYYGTILVSYIKNKHY